ncbi:hypothetical protein RJ639_038594 [Escallonia herrerae]|uniref:Uncharacterized protein n=1 Tax=Escallonia herrerae TaxID=1293975 RepID=A0AA88WIM2_9ASTE|nr:hypothetical protein RJ639_038594 [Escallonia herrerae]
MYHLSRGHFLNASVFINPTTSLFLPTTTKSKKLCLSRIHLLSSEDKLPLPIASKTSPVLSFHWVLIIFLKRDRNGNWCKKDRDERWGFVKEAL